jgi:hypothetical protein
MARLDLGTGHPGEHGLGVIGHVAAPGDVLVR